MGDCSYNCPYCAELKRKELNLSIEKTRRVYISDFNSPHQYFCLKCKKLFPDIHWCMRHEKECDGVYRKEAW